MIQKYTKKPVTIEAIQLQPDYKTIEECIEFIWSGLDKANVVRSIRRVEAHGALMIPTLEGQMQASFGDFIIKGVKGEFYPCKPDIFYATYDGPTRVLWDHTTGEYDKEYFRQEKGQ